MRRKFVDALPLDEELAKNSVAAKGVEQCNIIFAIERKLEELSPEERFQKRQEWLNPTLDEFFAWVETVVAADGTKLAKAIQYAKNEKKYLYMFLAHSDTPIDNNRAENAIRPFVVGRKNWLFSTSPKGAEASAIIYSVAATACANGLNVEKYLTNIFKSHGDELIAYAENLIYTQNALFPGVLFFVFRYPKSGVIYSIAKHIPLSKNVG